jgi:hypothetical protein
MITDADIRLLNNYVDQLIIKRDIAHRSLNRKRVKYRALSRYLEDVHTARSLIQLAAQITQEDLEFHVSNLVSSALYSVFPKPYDFITRFVKRRNTTECDMFFHRDGSEMEPEFASGGGPLDVGSFASRLSQLTLEEMTLLLLLDEPFKNLSRNLIHNVCEMLITLKKKLGVQFIIVTHIVDLIKAGDKVFSVHNGEVKAWTSGKSSRRTT